MCKTNNFAHFLIFRLKNVVFLVFLFRFVTFMLICLTKIRKQSGTFPDVCRYC